MYIKRISVFILSFSFLVLSTACKKDSDDAEAYTCTTCTTQPEALAANNTSSKGIYKGVVIGSSGTISFNILNDGTSISAKMMLDGTTVNLTSNITWAAGEAIVAPFTGTLNGSPVSITFSVNANGGSPTVTTSSIPGHPNSSFTIAKETSNALIEGFEGTFTTTKPAEGTFNLLLSRPAKVWGAKARQTGSTDDDSVSGIINSDNQIVEDDGTVMGTLSGDEINGSFKDSGARTVTIKGKRTL